MIPFLVTQFPKILFMFDNITRIEQLLTRIEEAILLIQSKSESVQSPDDFLLSMDGTFLLSGICMQLIFIGESVKTIDNKTNHTYLIQYAQIPWNEIMGLRDIIAHEYHKIDEEEIFNVIKRNLPLLLVAVRKMKTELR